MIAATSPFSRFALALAILVFTGFGPLGGQARADPSTLPGSPGKNTAARSASPLVLLQQFVSRADGERCPMYPTCSQYARQAIAEEGLLKGWVLTTDRLLRCGRDETRLAPPINVHGVRHTYDPLVANTFWWDKR